MSAEDQEHIDEVRRIARWTGCPLGCGPDGHEPGCWVGKELPGPWRLYIDPEGGLHWSRKRRRRSRDLLTPRAGCCAICGERLDDQARRVGDNRCTRCYRAIFAEHRRRTFGGDER